MLQYDQIRQAFAGQAACVTQNLQNLDKLEDWQHPTRLDGWDIYTLTAHLLRLPYNLRDALNQPLPPGTPATADRLGYYSFKGEDEAGAITGRTRQTAAATTPQTIARDFSAACAQANSRLAESDPALVVKSFFGTIRLDDYLTTRLFELTVHSLDLSNALLELGKSALTLDPMAQAATIDILNGLLVKESQLQKQFQSGADPITFIEICTGRQTAGSPVGARLRAFS